MGRNARHPEGNSYSYEEESPPVDILHSPKLIMVSRFTISFADLIAVMDRSIALFTDSRGGISSTKRVSPLGL
jgi:hypothetical protein